MADKNLSEFVKVAPLLDEDDMASDSAAHGSTQQAIKAFGDAIKASISTPIFWNMLTAAPDVVGQGTWIRAYNNNALYQGFLYNSSNANLDNFTMNFRCPAGTYTLRFNLHHAANVGIVDVDIDAGEAGSHDPYQVGADYLQVVEIAALGLAAGAHTLKFRIDGKNGASSAYYMNLNGIYLQRTA